MTLYLVSDKELNKMHRRLDTVYKRIRWLENKYHHWKHYFEVKKKRVGDRLIDRQKLQKGIAHIRALLKNLSIQQVKGTGCSKEKRYFILRLNKNDICRLRFLLRSKNFIGRRTRKKDGELMDFTKPEKAKLKRLLNKD